MIVKKLGREALEEILENMSHSAEKGFSSEDIDRQLIAFCLNCPDPAAAMDLVIDAPRGTTSAEIVDEALAMPRRAVETWSESELAKDHPLRRWTLEK
jgi:hypothetical protein